MLIHSFRHYLFNHVDLVSTIGGIATLVQTRNRLSSSAKLLVPHVATRIWIRVYGTFEYSGDDPSVGCTSHPKVRSVYLIDSDLTFVFRKKSHTSYLNTCEFDG